MIWALGIALALALGLYLAAPFLIVDDIFYHKNQKKTFASKICFISRQMIYPVVSCMNLQKVGSHKLFVDVLVQYHLQREKKRKRKRKNLNLSL